MKKLLILSFVVVALFASCEGPPGRDGIDNEMYWFVREYTVASGRWELVNDEEPYGSYFQYPITISELDQELFKKGNVFCYMYRGNVQTPLPFTIHYIETDDASDYLWTETYSFEFSNRAITFYVNYSDFKTSIRPPETTFRVVLNY